MDILNVQSLVANGLITDVASIDPNKTYVTIGVYQPGNRPAGSGNNTYPSYALPLSELLSGVTYTASHGIALVGNDFQLASNLISQFTNDAGYLTSATTPITSADNGLNILSQVVELGGTLNKATTIDAPGANTLSFTDQVGLMFQTRDASGNFLMNNVGGTGTLAGSSGYVFSYLGDGGNTFTDAFIVINFGGANNLDTVTDFWNFGDYTQALNSNTIFNIGRFNHFDNSSSITVVGYSNTINGSGSLSVFGTGNIISGVSNKFILGNYDKNMVIDGNTGYVGIGILSPTVPLYVYTTSNSVSSIIRNDQYGGLEIQASTIPAVYLSDHSGVSTMEMWGYHGSGGVIKVKDGFSWRNKINNQGIAGVANVDTNPNWAFGTHNGNASISADTRIRIIGQDSTSSNFGLKITDVLGTNPIFTTRNDGNVGIGTSTPTAGTRLHVYRSVNDFLYEVKVENPNAGVSSASSMLISSDVGKMEFGQLSNAFTTYTGYGQTGDAFIRSGAGSRNLNITTDASNVGKILFFSRLNPTTDASTPSLAIDGSRSGFNILPTTETLLRLRGLDSTSSNFSLKVDNSASSPLLYVRNDGVVSMSMLPTSNVGLSSGDLYVETAANILANGDLVVGRKV